MLKIISVCTILFLSQGIGLPDEIHEAAKNGKLETVKKILNKNPESINARDASGKTPLHWAAENGHSEIVSLLLKLGADVNARTANSNTSLHFAAFKGHEEIVKILVENRANVNAVGEFDYTPLFYAMLANNGNIIRSLIEHGTDPYYKDKNGKMPIHIALYRKRNIAINTLIDLEVEIPTEGENGRFFIHRAAAIGHDRLVSYLIDKGVALTTLNDNGGTLLHSAAMGGLVELVVELAHMNFDVNTKNRYGFTPIFLAAMEGHEAVVIQLIKSGSDISLIAPDGKNAADYAADFGHQEIVQLFSQQGIKPHANQFTNLIGEYLGQEFPGSTPELFALGIASTIHYDHCAPEFSPDGREAYFSPVYTSRGDYIFSMKLINNRWTVPQIEPICLLNGCYMYPTLSKDGSRMYFSSDRSLDGKSNGDEMNIWFVERKKDGWSEPQYIGFAGGDEYGLSISADGTLYFMAFYDWGEGSADLYRSPLIDGKYSAPENLGKPINTEFYEDEPYIASDESYIIFDSSRPDEFEKAGIFISYREGHGKWTKPKNIASKLGMDGDIRFPKLSPDGRFLFFASDQNGNWDLYWVDAKVVEEVDE